MKILRPANVHEAITFAVQLNTKLSELRLGPQRPTSQIKPQAVVPFFPTSSDNRFGNLLVNKLSPKEIAKKQELGECLFCVEKWTKGHKCG